MPLGYSDPISAPALWDRLIVGGVPSPGILDRSNPLKAESRYKWDKKQGPGIIGANSTNRGRYLGEFVAHLLLWRNGPPIWISNDFVDWDNWIVNLDYDPSKKNPKPVDVFYPTLLDRGITSAYCDKIIAPYQIGPTMWKAEIHMTAFQPPIASPSVTPTSAAASLPPNTTAYGPPAPTAEDQQQDEIGSLLQQAQAP